MGRLSRLSSSSSSSSSSTVSSSSRLSNSSSRKSSNNRSNSSVGSNFYSTTHPLECEVEYRRFLFTSWPIWCPPPSSPSTRRRSTPCPCPAAATPRRRVCLSRGAKGSLRSLLMPSHQRPYLHRAVSLRQVCQRQRRGAGPLEEEAVSGHRRRCIHRAARRKCEPSPLSGVAAPRQWA